MLKHKILSAFFVICFASSASATNDIVCSGTVSIIGTHSPNGVYLKLSGMNSQVYICNLGGSLGSSNPIPAEQCKAIYSTLLTAYSMQKTLTVYFDNVQSGTNCTNFVPWETATSRWVALTN